MRKKEAIARIRELTGDGTIQNGNVRIIVDEQVGLFDNEMQKGKDFYFIPLVEMKPEMKYYHGREEVWKISLQQIVRHSVNPASPIQSGDGYVKHLFPISDAVRVYPEKTVSSEPSRTEGGKLTTRDRACITLRVPEADTEWVNDLINKHWELQRDHADYTNAHLHR